jgi:hypothetical protein
VDRRQAPVYLPSDDCGIYLQQLAIRQNAKQWFVNHIITGRSRGDRQAAPFAATLVTESHFGRSNCPHGAVGSRWHICALGLHKGQRFLDRLTSWEWSLGLPSMTASLTEQVLPTGGLKRDPAVWPFTARTGDRVGRAMERMIARQRYLVRHDRQYYRLRAGRATGRR